jgi:hypothetical protein
LSRVAVRSRVLEPGSERVVFFVMPAGCYSHGVEPR